MCRVKGCTCSKIKAKGYCARHYNQMLKYGKISDRINGNINNITIKDEIAIIDLYDTMGNKIGETIIDAEDVELVKQYSWSLSKGRHTQYCKSNLRICTNQENICNCEIPKNNKSGCKGVYWAKDKNKWTVQVTINNKTIYIGRYTNLEEAIEARKEASKKYYNEFAND